MAGKEYRLGILITLRDKMTLSLEKMNATANKTKAALDKINKAKVNPTVKLNDQVTNKLKTIEDKLKNLGSKSIKIGGAAAAAGLGYGLKLAGEMEQANIAFETMLGSADKAKQFMNDLTDFAVKTPFEMPQLRDVSRKILAFGFDSQKVIPMLTAVGDAASGLGLGGEGMERIVVALGQMKAKAKVSGDEMLQLTEAGVPAWEILAEAMGKTTPEVMKLSEKGLLPANEAIDMLVAGMEKKFPKMMDKQSRSLFGLLSTLKDFANLRFFYAFGEGIRQVAVPALQKFVDMLDKNKDGTKTIQDRLESLGKTIGTSVVSKFEKLYNWILTLENDEKFKNMNWGDKFIYVIDQGLTALDDWITKGEGKGKLDSLIGKIAEIAAESWFKAEQKLLTMGTKNIGEGNYAAGFGELFMANKLSGNLLGMGAGYLGVNLLGWLGKKGGSKLLKLLGLGPKTATVAEIAMTAEGAAGPMSILPKLGRAGKLLGPLGYLTLAGSTFYNAYKGNANATARGTGGILGGIAGGAAAGMLGAGPIGAAVGAIIGGIFGEEALGKLMANADKWSAALFNWGQGVGKWLSDGLNNSGVTTTLDTVATWFSEWGDTIGDKLNNLISGSSILGDLDSFAGKISYVGSVIGGWLNKLNPFNENPAQHASGGIMTRPHLGLVAEAGPEAIIPLASSRRSRGIQLWQQAGQMLGVAGAGGMYVNANVNVAWDTDEDALAMRIGRQIVAQLKQALQNRA